MKLGIQLLNSDATLNNFEPRTNVKINQGETLSLVFRLIDKEKKIRFVPTAAANVLLEIARFPDVLATGSNQRVNVDYSVRRNAGMLFPSDDRSIWYVPLLSSDTANMMSSNIRVTVTDGANTYIALMHQALVVTRSEYDPEPATTDTTDYSNDSGTF